MSLIASLTNLGGPDLIVILLIVLVLFGAKKLPELARGMGQAVKEFQKAKDEFNDELHKAGQPDDKSSPTVQSTVPQNPPTGAVRPDPNQTIPPGNQSGQV
jgi:sec-independent protein translocase protein TatA